MIKDNLEKAVTVYSDIPYSVLSQEIPAYKKNDFYQELGEIMEYYKIYENGADFAVEGTNGDYQGSDVRFRKNRELINKEARFLFAHTPDFFINKNIAHSDSEKKDATIANDYVQAVLAKTGMGSKLVRAAKDCFIGKRVGVILNFNAESGISITFLKSYEFIYEKDSSENLIKFVAFYTILDTSNKKDKRIKKKIYEMENGVCYSTEAIYDGLGNLVEETFPRAATSFEYIPAAVIINDGLSNDGKGESEMDADQEGLYSKLANTDIDAERKSMNAIRYTIDADSGSTANLSSAPGAYWDIKSDKLTPDPKTAQVGMLESSMNYSTPLKTTLDRVNNYMHGQLDVPDINSEQLQGVITSGKTLKALYWGLIVRCDEKMLAWKPALEHVVRSLLDGAVLYPEAAALYSEDKIPAIVYEIDVVNNYPLLEDDTEEKTMDLSEVESMSMSRKAYMKKWRGLTDEEVDEELEQILKEQQMFNSAMIPDERAEEDEEDMEDEEFDDEEDDIDTESDRDIDAEIDSLLKEIGG